MSYSYKQINNLQRLTTLNTTDMLLVARAGSANTSYTTYQTTFATLSNDLVSKVSDIELRNHIITSMVNCTPTATTSAVAGKIAYELNNKVTTLSTNINYVNSNLALSVSNINTTIQNATNPTTINNIVKAKAFSNNSPAAAWSYIVSNEKNIDMNIYYNLSSSTMKIAVAQAKDGPLIHIVSRDSLVTMSCKGTGSNVYVFTSPNTESLSKQQIKSQQSNFAWHCIGHFASKTDVIYLPCKAGTRLCFYYNATLNTNASFKPNFKNDYGSSDYLYILEFSA